MRHVASKWLLAATLLAGVDGTTGCARCKRKAAPPVESDEDGAREPPQINAPVTRIEADGVTLNVVEPATDASLLARPEGLVPLRDEFSCPGSEEFEPTGPDPQPGFGMDDLRALFPDMPADKIPVKMDTDEGSVDCEVWPGVAPTAAAEFLGLATGARAWWHPCEHRWVTASPYYDRLRFIDIRPAEKLSAGCLYEGCEAAAGFERTLAESGAPFDRPGLLLASRAGPAGEFAVLDCQWVPGEPSRPLEGTCRLSANLPALQRDWVAFGTCEHEGLSGVFYRLARVAPDRTLDPHGLYWVRVRKADGNYYRYQPEPPAGADVDAGEAGTTTPAPVSVTAGPTVPIPAAPQLAGGP